MFKVPCILLLQSVDPLKQLAGKTVLDRVLERLRTIRGLDRLIGVADAAVMPHYATTSFDEFLTVKRMPPDDALLRTVKATHALICVPTLPLMGEGKIEKMLSPVRRGKAASAAFIRHYGRLRVTVDGFRAVSTATGSGVTVEASLVESLDVRNHDEYQLISAYLAQSLKPS